MKTPCSCRVVYEPVGRIEFCPLHKAAEEMFQTLEAILLSDFLYGKYKEDVERTLKSARGLKD